MLVSGNNIIFFKNPQFTIPNDGFSLKQNKKMFFFEVITSYKFQYSLLGKC
jgi:hypothetical protein